MREILFRGKRVSGGDWVVGYFFAKPILGTYFIILGESQWMVDPKTVCQYTGLKDKNGSRIFEGDIIELERGWSEKVRYIVEYDAEICSFIGDSINYIGFTTFENDGERIELIGNIYDTTELLEVETC